jgi:hypothetical protein
MGKEGEPLANRPTAAPSDQARHHCWDQGHRCKPSARVAFRIAAIVAPSGRFPA